MLPRNKKRRTIPRAGSSLGCSHHPSPAKGCPLAARLRQHLSDWQQRVKLDQAAFFFPLSATQQTFTALLPGPVLSPGKQPPQQGEEQRSPSGRQSPSCSKEKEKEKKNPENCAGLFCLVVGVWVFLYIYIYMEVLWL